jgi:hypothetical protein
MFTSTKKTAASDNSMSAGFYKMKKTQYINIGRKVIPISRSYKKEVLENLENS